jgi:hypothetical protein
VLLGCAHRAGRGAKPFVWQAATDPLFEPPIRADDDIELLALPGAVERIVQRAEAKGRLIVAWSEHELDVVKDHAPKCPSRPSKSMYTARRASSGVSRFFPTAFLFGAPLNRTTVRDPQADRDRDERRDHLRDRRQRFLGARRNRRRGDQG